MNLLQRTRLKNSKQPWIAGVSKSYWRCIEVT